MNYLVRATRFVKQSRLLCSLTNTRVDRDHKSLVSQVQQKDAENMLHVHWKDKSVSRFPYIYLRDICNCSKCLDATSLQRKLDTVGQIDLDIKAKSVNISQDGEKIRIDWPGDHVSEFDSSWLHEKRLKEKEEKKDTTHIARESVRLWDREDMQDKIPRFDYEKIIKEDEALYDWLITLDKEGIALLNDAPKNTDPIAILVLARRVGYVKSTHYG
jgi:gamma-butyrobetaine dioxygenase